MIGDPHFTKRDDLEAWLYWPLAFWFGFTIARTAGLPIWVDWPSLAHPADATDFAVMFAILFRRATLAKLKGSTDD